jgi:low temperature requirement protein LtrA
MTSFIRPLQLRYVAGAPARKVTWLELFFDLIFVAAVAQVGEPLREDFTLAGIVRFGMLFVLIWWAWIGNSVFATRFDTDDWLQRALTFVQMFAVAAMAANASDALDSHESAGFAAAYAAMRLILVAHYARARQIDHARPLANRYLAGHGLAAALWLLSAFVPAPARFAVWALALAIDLGTPWMAVAHSARIPPDPAHLPERFGLFTIILLGESVIAVMHGMKGEEDWSVAPAMTAILGMGIAFIVWSWYFDGGNVVAERHLHSHEDAVRFHVWSYAHLPLYLGIAVAAAGVERMVHFAAGEHPPHGDGLILSLALAIVMLSMVVILASSPHGTWSRGRFATQIAIAAAAVASGLAESVLSPAILVLLFAVLCALQVALSQRAEPAGEGSLAAA